MKIKNLVIGARVQVKATNHAGFYSSSAGKCGVINDVDDGTFLDVHIKYDDGSTEWGNHKGIKRADEGVSSLDDVQVGDVVEILDKRLTAFFDSNKGRTGTVTRLDPDSTNLNVKVEFDDGDCDWGNHKDIRILPKPVNEIVVGTRVRLKDDHMLGFRAGDVGTVKSMDAGGSTAVYFDVAREGWEDVRLGIPDLHGLWVDVGDLEVITD